jgi:hypothetical protein
MATSTLKLVAAMVISAMEAKRSDSEIAQELITSGFDPSDAPSLISSVRLGFQSGVQSIIMGTGAHPNSDIYYHAAFARGRAAMRFTTPAWVLVRMLAPFVFIGIILAFLIWRFLL